MLLKKILLDQVKSKIQKAKLFLQEIKYLKSSLNRIQEAIGRLEARQLEILERKTIASNEFQVFSQWGEDGIIQFLLRNIDVPCKIFVEFGVQNYTESNTRFLLVKDNWSGLLIEANKDDVQYIKQDPIYWRYNLKIVNHFITKDNINNIFLENGIQGKIGILSIDIDGNDYWIWQAINVITPAIVVAEYNFRFGKDIAVTVPYDEQFVRSKAHYSMIYYGASLKALYLLGKQKGYIFVGCNSAGNNAFFVHQDFKPEWLKELTVEEGYVAAMFRESRDKKGNLLYLSHEEEQELISSLPLVKVE